MQPATLIIGQNIEEQAVRQALWEIYRRSFAGSEKICAQNQCCYTEETFKAALTDSDYWKFYLLLDSEVIAYMLSTNNLQKASITYMNPEKYLADFPDYAPNKIYYCTSLAVRQEYRRNPSVFYQIMSGYLRHIFCTLKGMHAFDFSHETIPNLPAVLEKMGRKLTAGGLLPAFSYRKVGAQEFGTLVPKKSTP